MKAAQNKIDLEPRDAEAQAVRHRYTRRAHDTELAEDYLEVIADLLEERGEARIVDIARRLGVTHVTVTRTVRRLQRDDLVSAQPYRAIFLTERGKRLALKCRKRHQLVVDFLKFLGVSDKVAEADAEGIEHHVSAETLAAFSKFVSKGRSNR